MLLLGAIIFVAFGAAFVANHRGLAAALSKNPAIAEALAKSSLDFLSSDWSPYSALALGATGLLFGGIWYLIHEALKLRYLARDRGTYLRAGDADNAAAADLATRDSCFWIAVLAVPLVLLAALNHYLLSGQGQPERAWLSLTTALAAPLLMEYLVDRIAIIAATLSEQFGLKAAFGRTAPGAAADTRSDSEATTNAELEPAPPVRIELSPREVRVPPGETGAFQWDVTGARSAILHSRTRNERFAVPLQGSISVAMPIEEETFELVATGMDGRQHARSVQVSPQWAAVGDSVHEAVLVETPRDRKETR